MKKTFKISLVLVILSAFCLSISATSPKYGYIIDFADILSFSEQKKIEEYAKEISNQNGVAVHVIIVDSFNDYGNSPENALDNLAEEYELGIDGNAIAMLLSMDGRDYYIEDYGDYGMYALTDYGRSCLENAMLPYFRQNDWYDGLVAYLEECEELFTDLESGGFQGEFYETEYEFYDQEQKDPFLNRLFTAIAFALPFGLLAAFVVCHSFKKQMNTAEKATSANEYVTEDGVEMLVRQDVFVHTTRTRRKIESSSGSSSHGARGGSVSFGGGRGGGKSGGGGKF